MQHVYLFLITALAMILVPGLDTALVTRNTISKGLRGGIKTALGTGSGIALHSILASAGLSAILLKSALTFEIIKYAGALYLFVLGIVFILTKKKDTVEIEIPKKYANKSSYVQGLLSNVLNPKAIVFFWTFLPQFVAPGNDAFWSLTGLGMVLAILTALWLFVYAGFISKLRKWIEQPRVQQQIKRVTGIVLIGLGIRIAIESRK
ncbi:LysE family translocator [Alicyclobacillus tolerans]|uniref:LysE family translocator n=1 Tax=Alicyclobacillus tolerans TaxID=90970 RepID=UPI001F247535|nr:LysE family translocator [Alicyclobacillus tolerans]MCF8564659.1 LysE family translocator [Alicyclobacillus tolerans]